LKKGIADETAQKDSKLKELNDFGKSKHDLLQKRHTDKVNMLKKSIEDLENKLAFIKNKNKTEE
jgi:hypothetical protein